MKTTASSTTKCVQCGKRICKGEECYEVAKGGLAGAALNAVPGFWNTRIFCSQGCLNAYKGANGGSSAGSPVGGTTKIVHKEGMKASTKDLIVKVVVGVFILCIFGGLVSMCSTSHDEKKGLKALAAAEPKTFTLDKSSVELKGSLSDFLDVYDSVTAVTAGEDLSASITVTLPLQCKKSFNEINKSFLNSWFYPSVAVHLESVPSSKDLASSIYSMKPGDKKVLKFKLKTKKEGSGATDSIKDYQSLIESLELGNLIFTLKYNVKEGVSHYQREF